MTIKTYKVQFKNYIQKYIDSGEEPFLLKASHTGDVVSIITSLGTFLNLDERQLKLAKLTALFHDLGRFVQYDKYKTFNDKLSIDHSEESVNILNEQGFLNDLPLTEQNLIKTAIIEHNKKFVSANLSPQELSLSLLIRDADKLSNFPLFIKNYHRFTVPSNNTYSDEFIQLVLAKTPINNSELKTIEDYYIYHLSWFNDLNYAVSLNFAHEEQYITKIIENIKVTEVSGVLIKHFNELCANGELLKQCDF